MDFDRNPFWVLGVSTRDDRRRIAEIAESHALDSGSEDYQKAKSDLTHPRLRLPAELGWLPGIDPEVATRIVSQAASDPLSVLNLQDVPPLSRANLLAAALRSLPEAAPVDSLVVVVNGLAHWVAEIRGSEVLALVNADRAISGFPEIKSVDQVEAELAERLRAYRNVIRESLDKLPSTELVEVVTRLIHNATEGGTTQGPALIDEVVDSYAMEAQAFLGKESETILRMIETIRSSAAAGEAAIAPMVDQLERVSRNWDKLAQPIQLSARSRGIEDAESSKIGFAIRSLSIDLYNEHNYLATSRRMSQWIAELFAELPELVEATKRDSEALARLEGQHQIDAVAAELIELCDRHLQDIDASPSTGRTKAQEILAAADGKFAELRALGMEDDQLTRLADRVALSVHSCMVSYGNATKDWDGCYFTLQRALNFPTSQEAAARIGESLTTVKGNRSTATGNAETNVYNLIYFAIFIILMIAKFAL